MGEEEEERNISSSTLLVYGNPKPFRGNQTAESVGDTKVNPMVRNIVLRMRVRVFGSSKLETVALDCTQGLTKVKIYIVNSM